MELNADFFSQNLNKMKDKIVNLSSFYFIVQKIKLNLNFIAQNVTSQYNIIIFNPFMMKVKVKTNIIVHTIHKYVIFVYFFSLRIKIIIAIM